MSRRQRCVIGWNTGYDSRYYPPRAPRYHAARSLWFRLRRRLGLERWHWPGGISAWAFLLGLALPGAAFFALGRRIWGCLATIAAALGLWVWLAALGYGLSSFAFTAVLSIHVTGAAAMLLSWGEQPGLRVRLLTTALTLAALFVLIYLPLQNTLNEHVAMPVRMKDQVVVVRPRMPAILSRGAMVAYRIEGARANNVIVASGLGLDRVLAVAGERVDFFADRLEINGVRQARDSTMPVKGSLLVPPGHWLIWPRMDVTVRGGPQADIAGALAAVALVRTDQLIGTPYRRWFGRIQKMPVSN